MRHSQIRAGEFLPAHQNTPKPIHPIIQTYPFGQPSGCRWTVSLKRCQRFLDQLHVVTIGTAPSTTTDRGIPFASVSRLRLTPCFQNSSNTPASLHSLNRRYAEEQEQIPVASSEFHCGWGFGLGRSGSILLHSSSLIRHPSSLVTHPMIPLLKILSACSLSYRNRLLTC